MSAGATFVVSEDLLELLLTEAAAGAEPLVLLAELHDYAASPGDDCQPGPRRRYLEE